MSAGPEPLEITTDVLVIGGGLAAGWAAAAAVQAFSQSIVAVPPS